MVKSKNDGKVIYDVSYAKKSHPGESGSAWHNFTKRGLADMYQEPTSRRSANMSDTENTEMDIAKLLKDVERLGTSSMPWKERKALENRNVVALGGKPIKKHRTPLSVAKPAMKNQKKKEKREMEEAQLLGRFIRHGGSERKRPERRRAEDRVLKASEGRFSKGVLDVKHLLKPQTNSRSNDTSHDAAAFKGKRKGKGKGKGKKGGGKGKKGGGKRKGR